jgi:hypothetical protein
MSNHSRVSIVVHCLYDGVRAVLVHRPTSKSTPSQIVQQEAAGIDSATNAKNHYRTHKRPTSHGIAKEPNIEPDIKVAQDYTRTLRVDNAAVGILTKMTFGERNGKQYCDDRGQHRYAPNSNSVSRRPSSPPFKDIAG